MYPVSHSNFGISCAMSRICILYFWLLLGSCAKCFRTGLLTLVMIYNARGEMSLVWALGKNTSPGRKVGTNPNLLNLVITCAFAYSSDAGTSKTIIVS